jgi:hypothetical protein
MKVRRPEFSIFVSQVVLDESAAGDPQMASKRIEILTNVPLLEITPEVAELAATLIMRLPPTSTCGSRRGAYRRGSVPRHELFADLELHAHRECGSTAKN